MRVPYVGGIDADSGVGTASVNVIEYRAIVGGMHADCGL